MCDDRASSSARVQAGIVVQNQGRIWVSWQHRPTLLFVVLISFAVTVALLLRWSGLDSQSLWLDEGYSLWFSGFTPKILWHALQRDTSAPLYYILLHYWRNCFGISEFSLRAFSALFGTLSLPLFYLLARKILADRIAVGLAMMLYAVSFFQIWYAQEARCYALLVFLSLASLYCSLRCLENRTTFRLCGLVLLLAATLYTHNMALFYLPGIAAVWFVYPAETTRRARVRDALLIFFAVLFLYMPWLPTLRRQTQITHRAFWVLEPKGRDLLDSLCVLSGFDVATLQDVFRSRFHVLRLFGFWTWAPIVLMIFVLCVAGGLYAARSEDRRKVVALVAYLVIPVLLVFAYSRLSTPIYINRVFLGSCALLPVAFCAPIAFQVGTPRKLWELIGLLILAGATVSAFGYPRRERKQDWRGVTEYLLKVPERRRLVVTVPDIAQVLLQYYKSGLFKTYPAMEISGVQTRLEPPDFLGQKRNADIVGLLSGAVISGQYKEVDVAMDPGAWPVMVKPTLEQLSTHCTSVDIVKFQWLEVRRCLVLSATGNYNVVRHK